MKCFDEDEIKAIKSALKCELRKNKNKNKKLSTIENEILEKVEHFECPEKILSVNEIKKLTLKERVKFARMINH